MDVLWIRRTSPEFKNLVEHSLQPTKWSFYPQIRQVDDSDDKLLVTELSSPGLEGFGLPRYFIESGVEYPYSYLLRSLTQGKRELTTNSRGKVVMYIGLRGLSIGRRFGYRLCRLNENVWGRKKLPEGIVRILDYLRSAYWVGFELEEQQ